MSRCKRAMYKNPAGFLYRALPEVIEITDEPVEECTQITTIQPSAIVQVVNTSSQNRNESVPENTSSQKSSPQTPPRPLNNDDDDGSTCSICMDTWEIQGDHRLVSLKCGHLFGDRCIKRWIEGCPTESKCCPTCKEKARLEDLRPLFAKRVVVADKSKEYHLQKLLDAANRKNVYLEARLYKKIMKLERLKSSRVEAMPIME